MPNYSTIRALRAGEVVEIEGLAVKMTVGKEYGESLVPGDTYVAERNTGPKLLTAGELKDGYVLNTGMGYPFDYHECVGVGLV